MWKNIIQKSSINTLLLGIYRRGRGVFLQDKLLYSVADGQGDNVDLRIAVTEIFR